MNSWLVASIFLFACTFRVPVAEGLMRPQFQLFAETGVILLLAAVTYKYANRWVALFLILAAFSAIYPSFGRWSYMARGVVVFGVLWYVFLVLTVKDVGPILNAICAIGIVNSVFGVLQYYGADPYNIFTFGLMRSVIKEGAASTGMMANANILSALVAFCLPAFFRRRWVYLMWIPIVGLYVARSSGGLIAAVIGVLFYCMLKKWHTGEEEFLNFYIRLAVGLVVAICLLAFFRYFDTFKYYSPTRVAAWADGLEVLKQHPFFGIGIGHLKLIKITDPRLGERFATLHNDPWQVIVEMGPFVIPIMLGYVFGLWRSFSMRVLIPATALLIVAANMQVNFPLHVGTTALLIVTWAAVYRIEAVKI